MFIIHKLLLRDLNRLAENSKYSLEVSATLLPGGDGDQITCARPGVILLRPLPLLRICECIHDRTFSNCGLKCSYAQSKSSGFHATLCQWTLHSESALRNQHACIHHAKLEPTVIRTTAYRTCFR